MRGRTDLAAVCVAGPIRRCMAARHQPEHIAGRACAGRAVGEAMQTLRVKRQYSDEEKALALVALDFNGGNLHRTARELTIPRKTLAAWAEGHNQCSDVAKKRQLRGDDLADRFEELIRAALEAITPEKMQAARLVELSHSIGVFVDKMLLLRGCTCGAAKGRRGLRRS